MDAHLQMVLAAVGLYRGGIDGIIGPKSMAAIAAAEDRFAENYGGDPDQWNLSRRKTGALQACLIARDFDSGPVDGYLGHLTRDALSGFLYRQTHGVNEAVRRETVAKPPKPAKLPRQSEVGTFYGVPGAGIEKQLTTLKLPFSFRIDWNLKQRTNRVTVHRKCAQSLEIALIAVRDHYGLEDMRALGIDRYAGAYNHRKMRGGSRWSMHAYGCAIDFFAQPNGLRTRAPQALFSQPEYKSFLDIMEQHGWLNGGRLWGADFMHFQSARM